MNRYLLFSNQMIRKIFLAMLASTLALSYAAAQHTVSGIVQNKAENLPLQAEIKLINKSTLVEYLTKSNLFTGRFTLNIPNDNFIL